MSEIHVSRRARNAYKFDEELFSPAGRAVVASYANARNFAEKMSVERPQPVPASDINAMGLLNEVFQVLIRQYELQNPGVFQRSTEWLDSHLGEGAVDTTLVRYLDEFPPRVVYHGEMNPEEYFTRAPDFPDGRVEMRRDSLEEILLLKVDQSVEER